MFTLPYQIFDDFDPAWAAALDFIRLNPASLVIVAIAPDTTKFLVSTPKNIDSLPDDSPLLDYPTIFCGGRHTLIAMLAGLLETPPPLEVK